MPRDVVEIGVTEILLGEKEIGIEPGCSAEFLNGPVPVVSKSIGIAQIIVWPRLVGRFLDRVGSEQEAVLEKLGPLVAIDAEHGD